MELKKLIDALRALDPNTVFKNGFHRPHSYRGYYDQLAFEPCENVTVETMLRCAEGALGETYQGWKGGEYTMREWTACWIARLGSCGEPLTRALFDAQLAETTIDALRSQLAALQEEKAQVVRELEKNVDVVDTDDEGTPVATPTEVTLWAEGCGERYPMPTLARWLSEESHG